MTDTYEADIARTATKLTKARKQLHDLEWATENLTTEEIRRIWNTWKLPHPHAGIVDLSEAMSIDSKVLEKIHDIVSWLRGSGLDAVIDDPVTCWKHIFAIANCNLAENERIIYVKKVYEHDKAHPSRPYRWSHIDTMIHGRVRQTYVVSGKTSGQANLPTEFKNAKEFGRFLIEEVVPRGEALRPTWDAELDAITKIGKAMVAGRKKKE